MVAKDAVERQRYLSSDRPRPQHAHIGVVPDGGRGCAHDRCGNRSAAAHSWAPFVAVLLLLGSSAPSAVLAQPAGQPPPPTALAPADNRGPVTIGSFVPTSVLAGLRTVAADFGSRSTRSFAAHP